MDLILNRVALDTYASWEEFDRAMKGQPWHPIDCVNWPAYPYRPQVHFSMAVIDDGFALHYRVKEQSVRAVTKHDNGEVWKDSCVEFFIAPADDGLYYNFEFNCAGMALVAIGSGREHRIKGEVNVMAAIPRGGTFVCHPFPERVEETEWELKILLPFEVFFRHKDVFPAKKVFKANFYKCGDELKEPHFLSWRPIDIPQPDFHRPEFFGTVGFDQ